MLSIDMNWEKCKKANKKGINKGCKKGINKLTKVIASQTLNTKKIWNHDGSTAGFKQFQLYNYVEAQA